MNNTLKRALISLAVAVVVYVVGDFMVGDYGPGYSNAAQVYIAAAIAGGCYWIGSKD